MSPTRKIYAKLYAWQESHKNWALLYQLVTGKLYQMPHLKVLLSDVADKREPVYENSAHCEEAVKWLFRAQDVTRVGGVSADYSFSWGWAWPLPEATGYIIPTLFNYAKCFDTPTARECVPRAIMMANWLIEIQEPNGAYFFSLHPCSSGSVVDRISSGVRKQGAFDTAQILGGLATAYEKTGNQCYLEAAIRGANWLVENLSPIGTWSASLHNCPHTFDAFAAWRLINVSELSGIPRFKAAAIKSLDWAISHQRENGWFNGCSHFPNTNPLTHGIAYAAQGFLEAGILLNEDRYIRAALRTAESLLQVYSIKNFLPARLDGNWRSQDKFSCLTGNAQVSIVWSKLYRLTGDGRFFKAALEMNQDLKSLQNLKSSNGGIRGGIKGSHPIWGRYASFRYPSWAAKFFVDALLIEEEIKGARQVKI